MIQLSGPEQLTPELYRRIVHEREKIALDGGALERAERSRTLLLKHLETGVVCYGVNTGLGAQSGIDLTTEEQALLPRHILLGRSVATGPAFPGAVARGAMLIKLAQLLTGYSAVSADLCRFIADRLNDGFTPYIPSEGLGMAGEIIPLCHLAQTLIGEGFVLGESGERVLAADWLRQRGVAPYDPKRKEGLSLINGIAVAPAAAFEVAARLRRTLSLATVTAAASVEGLGSPLEAFSQDVPDLRREAGLKDIAVALNDLLAHSRIERGTRQPPISFRIVPQVHGACLDAVRRLEHALVAEWRAIGDNPAFIADDTSPAFGRLVHSGNFHCAALTAEVEASALAVAQVALLSERRLHRLLDSRYSGLAPQLARRPGLDAGLVILHKAVLGLTAKLKSLATPLSLQHADSSFGQEDAMTMIFPALDRLAEINRLTRLVAVHELYAALVAIDQRGEEPGRGVAAVQAVVRGEIPVYEGDRSYGPELERLAALVEEGAIMLPGLP
jgi:histidine ammonia-lyase